VGSEVEDHRRTIEWLRKGLEHIRDGQHLCDAAALARQILHGHVWDAKWDTEKNLAEHLYKDHLC